MSPSRLVAGVDSSTQSCKVVVREAASGRLVRHGSAPHPSGTEVHPDEWGNALRRACSDAGGLDDIAAVSVAAQQHGMICLDECGEVVRDALLWNDTRSATAASDLVAELPAGAVSWAELTGSVPTASFTVSKLRWLASQEPASANRTAAICLPHDWLTWHLRSTRNLDDLVTDRSDASGTGYWSPGGDGYLTDIVERAFGRVPLLPTILGPAAVAGQCGDMIVGAGAGDNAAAALGLAAGQGDVIVSIGTSGVVSAVCEHGSTDPTGTVAGFADATGLFLPLVCTINAAQTLTAVAALLGVSLGQLSDLALSAKPGADGVVLVPYFEGERTPNKPDATAAVHGLRQSNSTPANLARAAVEGLLCGLADGLDALRNQGVPVSRVLLIGGGAQSPAVQSIAPQVLGIPVHVPATGEYVANGAARQAAWALSGTSQPPSWDVAVDRQILVDPIRNIREHYSDVRDLVDRRRDRA